ncbi:hypothetical protein EW146_g4899 [Bondarzewia mesenterica]|uniref:DNA helicase n=1 Tax=Bondarzewia mesenterica TaxID=1095465 RepID=A0A4S4LT41_9AGAM|nr:hypothetical protein EW146_g4899 [Bondarzewia mesenterica]
MSLSLFSNAYLRKTSAIVRDKVVPWEGYQRTGQVTPEELALINKVVQQPRSKTESILLSDGQAYALLYLRLLKRIQRIDVMQCILVLISDALADHDERIPLFTKAAESDPELPYDPLLRAIQSEDEFVQLKAAQILTVWLSSEPTPLPHHQLQPLLVSLSSFVQSTSPDKRDVAVQCLGAILPRPEVRKAVWVIPGMIAGLVNILKHNPGPQMNYQVGFCFWLLSFEQEVAEQINQKYDIIPLFVDIAQAAVKEKVIRVIVATFRNLVTKAPSANLPAMLVSQLLPFSNNLATRKWTDEDILEDVQFLRDELRSRFESLTTWDEYTSELTSGHLSWTPVHESDMFWKENAMKLNEKDYACLKSIALLPHESLDPVVLAVAAHDVGEYVKHYERGKKIVTDFGGKTRVMELMSHGNPDVRYQALVSVQQLPAMSRSETTSLHKKRTASDANSLASSVGSDPKRARISTPAIASSDQDHDLSYMTTRSLQAIYATNRDIHKTEVTERRLRAIHSEYTEKIGTSPASDGPVSASVTVGSSSVGRGAATMPSPIRESAHEAQMSDSEDEMWRALDGPNGSDWIRQAMLAPTNLNSSPPANDSDLVQHLLVNTFGLSTFRKNQREAIDMSISGKDVLMISPTGSGKSLCFQLPAVYDYIKMEKVTIVVQPLTSLMVDQANKLRAKGIDVEFINSGQPDEEKSRVRDRLIGDGPLPALLHVSPERLDEGITPFMTILRRLHFRNKLARFAIDEAHLIGRWGEFRTSVGFMNLDLESDSDDIVDFFQYLKLSALKDEFPNIPAIALTATADFKDREDIIRILRLRDAAILVDSMNRSNLYYAVCPKPSPSQASKALGDYVKAQHAQDSGIVYCRERKTCDAVAAQLRDHGLSADVYHSMTPEKSKVYDRWYSGSLKILVGTIAIGMGIDKSDVIVNRRDERDGITHQLTVFCITQLGMLLRLSGSNVMTRMMPCICWRCGSFAAITMNAVEFCSSSPSARRLIQDLAHSLVHLMEEIQGMTGRGEGKNSLIDIFLGFEFAKADFFERYPNSEGLKNSGAGVTLTRARAVQLFEQLFSLNVLTSKIVHFSTHSNPYIWLGSKAEHFLQTRQRVLIKLSVSGTKPRKQPPSSGRQIGSAVTEDAQHSAKAEATQSNLSCYEALENLRRELCRKKKCRKNEIFDDESLRAFSVILPKDRQEFQEALSSADARSFASKWGAYGQQFKDICLRYVEVSNSSSLYSESRAGPSRLPRNVLHG